MKPPSLLAREHGRYLYLYTNFRTHQVVYSLSRALNNTSILKQLTYYGKKTKPCALRKDIWRPFATVKFPTPEHGLNAIQKLREYRKLRDYTWVWKPTAAEIQAAKKQLEEEGRAPTFNMNLPTKKERARLLMDQRAYSVADLADVLERHEKSLLEREREKNLEAKKVQRKKEAEWQKVVQLAKKAKETNFSSINTRIRRKENRMKTEKMSERELTKTRTGVKLIKTERNELIRALEAVEFVEGTTIALLENRKKWNQALRAMVQERTDREVIPQSKDDKAAVSQAISVAKLNATATEEVNPKRSKAAKALSLALSTPSKPDAVGSKAETRAQPVDGNSGPEPEKTSFDRSEIPESAILIQWADLSNAEYAAQWPENVYHEWMGHGVIHSARPAGAEPRMKLKWYGIGDLTEEEVKKMEEGVDLDGESSEESGEGEGKEGDSEGQEKEEEVKEGRLARLAGRFLPKMSLNPFDLVRKKDQREGGGARY